MKLHLRWLVLVGIFITLAGMASATCFGSSVRGRFEKTLNVTGPVDLEVSTGSGDITVKPGNSGTVQIKGKVHADDNRFGGSGDAQERVRYIEAHPPIQQDGNHIRVGPIEDHSLSRHISIDYELEVPAETQLTTQTGSGDLSVEGIHGPMKAKTGSGDMKIHSINGSVQVKTGSGDGNFEEISGERVEIESGSGDMQLRDIRSALSVRTGSGDLTAEGSPTGEWVLHTGSGGITLRLPSDLAFDLDAHTSSGDVSSNLPITVEGKMGGGDLHGKVRGGGIRVEVRTSSGDIHIE